MIRRIITNYQLTDWEETSLEYCKLMLIKSRGGGTAVLLCRDKDWKVSAAIRYLSTFNIVVRRCVNIEELKDFESFSNDILISTEDIDLVVGTLGSKITRGIRKFNRLLSKKIGRKNSLDIIKLSFPYWRERREEIFIYVKDNIEKFEKLYFGLADKESKDVLLEIIRCSANNDIYRRQEGLQINKYWECYQHKADEVWVNCGSAVGDTILKFLDCGFNFKKIFAFEGSESEFERLEMILGKVGCNNIEMINEYIGVESSDNCFDNIFLDIPVSLINMDIEGAEMSVLRGARKIISKWRPVLAISTYHKASDLLEIPLFINETVENYKIYLRKYHGYEPNALNEYLYYAVPHERIKFCEE